MSLSLNRLGKRSAWQLALILSYRFVSIHTYPIVYLHYHDPSHFLCHTPSKKLIDAEDSRKYVPDSRFAGIHLLTYMPQERNAAGQCLWEDMSIHAYRLIAK
jgi:hypothetical protein